MTSHRLCVLFNSFSFFFFSLNDSAIQDRGKFSSGVQSQTENKGNASAVFFSFFFIQFLFSFIKMLPQIKLNNWGINIVNSLSFNCST